MTGPNLLTRNARGPRATESRRADQSWAARWREPLVLTPVLFVVFTLSWVAYGWDVPETSAAHSPLAWFGAIIGACLGAVVTALITNSLLDKQTQREAEGERAAKVFEEKLKVYDVFLKTLQRVTADGKLVNGGPQDEVQALVFQFAGLMMHTRPESVVRISVLIVELFEAVGHAPGTMNEKLQGTLIDIVSIFRRELFGDAAADAEETPDREGRSPKVVIADNVKLLGQGDREDALEAQPEALNATMVPNDAPLRSASERWTGESNRVWYANTGGRSWKGAFENTEFLRRCFHPALATSTLGV